MYGYAYPDLYQNVTDYENWLTDNLNCKMKYIYLRLIVDWNLACFSKAFNEKLLQGRVVNCFVTYIYVLHGALADDNLFKLTCPKYKVLLYCQSNQINLSQI
jgi:hypothetical protein